MFKLVVLSCLLSVAFAGHLAHPVAHVEHVAQYKSVVEPHVSIVETPTISQVGAVVKSIPTAHSYQSQTQYHSKSIVEPIYAHGVEKKYISTPVVKSVVEQVPVVKYVQEPVYAHAPAVYAQAAPVYAQSAPVYAAKSYDYGSYAAPAVQYVQSAPAYAAKSYDYGTYAHAAPAVSYSSVYAPKAVAYNSYPAVHAAPLAYSSYPSASYAPASYAQHW